MIAERLDDFGALPPRSSVAEVMAYIKYGRVPDAPGEICFVRTARPTSTAAVTPASHLSTAVLR